MRRHGPFTRAAVAVAALAFVGLGPAVASHAAGTPVVKDGCIRSVPEPDTTDPVSICYTLYQPAGADRDHTVPMILHSHGWGGTRTSDPTAFGDWLAAGFGVLSFDQRGFGESGGRAHVESPDFEGQDVERLVDLVAGLDWVAHDAPNDPVLGAIGGSYGGGYQFVGAFTELRDHGRTRFDALAPEITWWDLKESLAPQEVVRTEWATALYAAGAAALPAGVSEAFAYGAATGNWPHGELGEGTDLDEFFRKNGPAWHVSKGRRLDIPVLFGQGITDNLFNLNQGLQNFDHALTNRARARSIFVGYNGGHALPSVLPPGTQGDGDPCSAELMGGSGSFGDLSIRFFAEELRDEASGLGGRGQYHLATAGGRCVTLDSVEPQTTVAIDQVVSTAGAGAPVATKLADGPITVAGRSFVDAAVTTLTPDARAFLALAVGTSATDAQIVQNNMMPLREPVAVSGAARSIELPSVAVDVPAGQSLFLIVSPLSDMSFGHGSRVPGVVKLDGAVVHLPVVTG